MTSGESTNALDETPSSTLTTSTICSATPRSRTDECLLHANLFTLVRDFGKLPTATRLKILDYAYQYIHPRHLIRLLLAELDAEARVTRRRSVTDTRNAYKLYNSHSNRSIARVYNAWLSFLLNDQQQRQRGIAAAATVAGSAACTLHDEAGLVRHVTPRVSTNYSDGNDATFVEDEQQLVAALRSPTVQIVLRSVDEPSMHSHEASRVASLELRFVTQDRPPRLTLTDSDNAPLSSATATERQRDRELLTRINAYLEHAVHTRAIKLLDFALVSGYECWTLWNDTLDRALQVYNRRRLYPVKSSLFHLGIVVSVGVATASAVHLHGLNTNLGLLVNFVQSLRMLMHMSLLSCCYGMQRKALDRLNYTKQHDCAFPAASQGVYNQLFLTSKLGHELLCNAPVNTSRECVAWLLLYRETRRLVFERQGWSHSGLLDAHLAMLQDQL